MKNAIQYVWGYCKNLLFVERTIDMVDPGLPNICSIILVMNIFFELVFRIYQYTSTSKIWDFIGYKSLLPYQHWNLSAKRLVKQVLLAFCYRYYDKTEMFKKKKVSGCAVRCARIFCLKKKKKKKKMSLDAQSDARGFFCCAQCFVIFFVT